MGVISLDLRHLLVFLGREGLHFLHFPRIGFELLISKIRPTGFTMTGMTGRETFLGGEGGGESSFGIPPFWPTGPKSIQKSLKRVSGVAKQFLLRLRGLFRDCFGHFLDRGSKARKP